MTACPSQGYLSMTYLSMATFQVKADRQWQGHLSKASCQNNDCLLKQRLLVPSQGCLSMTACPSQDYLSRSRLLVNGHLSKARPMQDYRQRLLVQGKATCPISKSRLLVMGHFVRGKAACPSDGCCQWPLVNCCQWPLVNCCQWPLAQAKALLPTAASAVWRGSCTGT